MKKKNNWRCYGVFKGKGIKECWNEGKGILFGKRKVVIISWYVEGYVLVINVILVVIVVVLVIINVYDVVVYGYYE